MNELPLGQEPSSQRLRNRSWISLIAITLALMVLASGGTAILINIGTTGDPGGVPQHRAIAADVVHPDAGRSLGPVVVDRPVGAFHLPGAVEVVRPQTASAFGVSAVTTEPPAPPTVPTPSPSPAPSIPPLPVIPDGPPPTPAGPTLPPPPGPPALIDAVGKLIGSLVP